MPDRSVFIVEDDPVIAGEIASRLGAWGFEAVKCQNFADVLGEFAASGAALVLMDVGLPFFSGYYWCAELRKTSRVPVIFISSAGDDMNIVMAMSMGGDDFIAKPFSMEVLSAKVLALFRRAYDWTPAPRAQVCAGVELDAANSALVRDGARLELTRNELKIMQALFEHAGGAVSRAALMTALWEADDFVDENALSVCVARLRKKLEAAGMAGFIRTVKGGGYAVG